MKKSKFLKPFSFASLALLMGTAGVFAFAPLGANPNALATASETEYTTEQGLITPKADDPTLYTTESGLDIKFGLAMPTINASLPSGNLKGFPYFTTTSGSTTYTWVIIGRNSDVAMLSGGIMQYLYSQWKATSAISGSVAQYYFSNVDTTTPAGALIDTQASSKAYVYDKGIDSSIKVNDAEIPSGCVLVLLNGSSFVGTYNTTYSHPGIPSYRFCNWSEGYNMTIRATMEGYYTNKSLGLGTITDNIQNTLLKTYECNWQSGSDWAWRLEQCYHHIFPLCATTNGGSNFMWNTYLTADQMENGFSQALRAAPTQTGASSDYSNSDGVLHYRTFYFYNKTQQTTHVNATNFSYRPAFVLKIA